MSRRSSTQRRGAGAPPGRIRIIGGRLRGRTLVVPSDAALRPTPNRVRETLFNWLRDDIAGARCLDLFAGTGALGIEALSRGAAAVTFVDSDRRTAALLRTQLARLELDAAVVCADAQRFLAETDAVFDVVFADPPFAADASAACRAAGHVLRPGGALYCERDFGDALPDLGWADWAASRRAGAVRFGLARKARAD